MQSDLSIYRDHHRLVIVFAASAKDVRYVRQVRAWREAAGEMRERDLIRLSVFTADAWASGRRVKGLDSASLRARYKVSPDDFRVLLVGKDGTVKLDRQSLLTPKEVFALIDTMPMRREEVRRKGR